MEKIFKGASSNVERDPQYLKKKKCGKLIGNNKKLRLSKGVLTEESLPEEQGRKGGSTKLHHVGQSREKENLEREALKEDTHFRIKRETSLYHQGKKP